MGTRMLEGAFLMKRDGGGPDGEAAWAGLKEHTCMYPCLGRLSERKDLNRMIVSVETGVVQAENRAIYLTFRAGRKVSETKDCHSKAALKRCYLLWMQMGKSCRFNILLCYFIKLFKLNLFRYRLQFGAMLSQPLH